MTQMVRFGDPQPAGCRQAATGGGLGLAGVAVVLVLLWAIVQPDPRSGSTRFDQHLWQRAGSAAQGRPNRADMAADLVDRFLRPGTPADAVVALLGTPAQRSRYRLCYILTTGEQEPYCTNLEIGLDSADKVVDATVTSAD